MILRIVFFIFFHEFYHRSAEEKWQIQLIEGFDTRHRQRGVAGKLICISKVYGRAIFVAHVATVNPTRRNRVAKRMQHSVPNNVAICCDRSLGALSKHCYYHIVTIPWRLF